MQGVEDIDWYKCTFNNEIVDLLFFFVLCCEIVQVKLKKVIQKLSYPMSVIHRCMCESRDQL